MRYVLIGVLVALGAGCKYNKETVPASRAPVDVRVPNQQKVVALATEQAVEALDLSKLQGKSVAIELTGVFPHSEEDLLAYVRAQVEAKLARSGARVVAQPPVLVVPGAENAATRPGGGSVGALTLADPPDVRLLVGVSWGGIDIRDKVTTDEPLLTKQIGLAAGGLIAATLLVVISDSSFRQTFAVLGGAGTVAGSALWYKKKSPFPHVVTLYGRMRVVAQAVPTKEGTAFTTEGTGESKIVTDDRNPEGYMVVK